MNILKNLSYYIYKIPYFTNKTKHHSFIISIKLYFIFFYLISYIVFKPYNFIGIFTDQFSNIKKVYFVLKQ